MIITENIKSINKKLIDYYGKDASLTLPKWKIVWSSDEYEIRTNPDGFDIYVGDQNLFLRTEYGPHEVEKYPLFPDMWVLEELTDASGQSLLIETKYSYEPRWFFGAQNSNPTPIWRAVEVLIRALLEARCKKMDSQQTVIDNEAERMAKEKTTFKEILHDNGVFMGEDQVGYTPTVIGEDNATDTDSIQASSREPVQ